MAAAARTRKTPAKPRPPKVEDLFVAASRVKPAKPSALTSVEICAGAGGQALGVELAGFGHTALVEIDKDACATLRANRPSWNVSEGDLRSFSGKPYKGIDLLAGGVPCPPFSVAGKQLGNDDERDLFPEAVRLVDEIRPTAVMLENVPGLLEGRFEQYRADLEATFGKLGYKCQWKLHNARDFGVSQLRPRVIFVAIRSARASSFEWPQPLRKKPPTVGECLYDLMAERGWRVAHRWKEWANDIAPTLVGGSKKHGGPDLGPTRAKRAWEALCVDGHGLADQAPDPDFRAFPRLTPLMAARLQGFPDTWRITGRKTAAYRQIGNAFPAPVAEAVARQIAAALTQRSSVGIVAA